jgi:predicted DNA-binding transcriptional regulator YafY
MEFDVGGRWAKAAEPYRSRERVLRCSGESCESLALPSRRVDDEVMTALMAGFASRQGVAISYQSLTTAEVTRRLICPHHVVDTGDRVHVRAWDDRRRLFSDFVLGRILRAELDPEYPWVDAIADTSWNETIEVVLAPDRNLSASQKAAIKREFRMKDGRVAIPVRKALLVYFLGRLGLLEAVRRGDSSPEVSRGINCLNPHDLTPWLPNLAAGRRTRATATAETGSE